MNLNNTQKKAAADALKEGLQAGYEASKTRPNLKWWERLLWVILAGVASVATALLTPSCTPAQVQQVQQVQQVFELGHDAYHIVHPDKPCIIIPLDESCEK